MTRPLKIIAILLSLLITLVGCAVVPKTTRQMKLSSPEEALALVAGRFPDTVTLQAIADIRINTQEGRFPLKAALMLKKPASLRMEAIPMVGTPSFFLSVHEGRLKVFSAETKAFYIGRANAENIARYLPLKIDPEELIFVLTGSVSSTNGNILRSEMDQEHYRIDISESPQQILSLWMRLSDGFVERIEIAKQQRGVLRARFASPLEVGKIMLPQLITIDTGDEKDLSVSIRYKDISLLTPHEQAPLFDITLPPGIAPVYLD